MFDIGFTELLLLAVVGLLVLGPERLPGAIRTGRLLLGRVRHSLHALRQELERELDTDDLKRTLHNDAVIKGLSDTPYDRQADNDPSSPDERS